MRFETFRGISFILLYLYCLTPIIPDETLRQPLPLSHPVSPLPETVRQIYPCLINTLQPLSQSLTFPGVWQPSPHWRAPDPGSVPHPDDPVRQPPVQMEAPSGAGRGCQMKGHET